MLRWEIGLLDTWTRISHVRHFHKSLMSNSKRTYPCSHSLCTDRTKSCDSLDTKYKSQWSELSQPSWLVHNTHLSSDTQSGLQSIAALRKPWAQKHKNCLWIHIFGVNDALYISISADSDCPIRSSKVRKEEFCLWPYQTNRSRTVSIVLILNCAGR